jgi:hypothetical protein
MPRTTTEVLNGPGNNGTGPAVVEVGSSRLLLQANELKTSQGKKKKKELEYKGASCTSSRKPAGGVWVSSLVVARRMVGTWW